MLEDPPEYTWKGALAPGEHLLQYVPYPVLLATQFMINTVAIVLMAIVVAVALLNSEENAYLSWKEKKKLEKQKRVELAKQRRLEMQASQREAKRLIEYN